MSDSDLLSLDGLVSEMGVPEIEFQLIFEDKTVCFEFILN